MLLFIVRITLFLLHCFVFSVPFFAFLIWFCNPLSLHRFFFLLFLLFLLHCFNFVICLELKLERQTVKQIHVFLVLS